VGRKPQSSEGLPGAAYCQVPAMLGITAGRAVLGLYALAVPETALPDGSIISAGFAYGDHIIQSAIGLLFTGWIFLLLVKAIRILNGFGYARSAVILVLAVLIVYAANLAQGMATVVIDEFVL